MNMQNCLRAMGSLAVFSVLLGGGSASAMTILIDLGNQQSFRGADVVSPDSNGNYWTSVWSGAFYGDVVDAAGNTTAVDFGFTSAGGTDSYNGPAGTSTNPADSVYNAAALGSLGVDAAVFDYYVSSTFQLQQLDPTKKYNLTFFGSHKYNDNNTTTYTVYTDSSFSTPVASTDLLVGVDDAHNQANVATINGLSPQVDDILYIGFAGSAGGNGYLNALQIEEVPEPGALLLLVCGSGLGLFVRRR